VTIEPSETQERAYSDLDDGELLSRSRSGDPQPYGELWLRHVIAARAFARRIMPADMAEDAVDEAFLSCWKAIRNGKGPHDNFRAYLFQAVRTRAVRPMVRAAKERPTDEFDMPEASSPSPDEWVIGQEERSYIAQAFYSLQPRYRKALLLSEVEGLPGAVVAERLGVNANTAYQIVFRAKNKLREQYLHYAGEDRLGAAADERAGPEVPGDSGRLPVTKLGAALATGVVGVSAATYASSGYAQAFGGVAEITQPSLMPVFPPSPQAGGNQVVTGVAAGAAAVLVILALIAILVTSHPTPAANRATVPSPSVTPTPSVTTPSPTPSETTPAPAPPPTTATPPVTTTPPPATTAPPHTTTTPPTTAPSVPPILIAQADVGPSSVCFPSLSGTGVPGSRLTIQAMGGVSVPVVVGANGTWSTGPLTQFNSGTKTIYVSADDNAQQSASESVTVAAPPSFGVSRVGTGISVLAHGTPGLNADVVLDGTPLGTLTFDAAGQAYQVFPGPIPAGAHTVALNYNAGTCTGPVLNLPVTV